MGSTYLTEYPVFANRIYIYHIQIIPSPDNRISGAM